MRINRTKIYQVLLKEVANEMLACMLRNSLTTITNKLVSCTLAAFLVLSLSYPSYSLGTRPRETVKELFPRFASIRASRANVRMGPSREHSVIWTFVKTGMPVEVIRQFDVWYKIRDSEGEEGWIQKVLISSLRTAIVTPISKTELTEMTSLPKAGHQVIAELRSRVLVDVLSCDGVWCRVKVGDYVGYVLQERLWGVYPGEVIW